MTEETAPVLREIKEALPEVEEKRIKEELDRYLKYGIVAKEAKKAIIRKLGGTPQTYAPQGEKRLKDLDGNEMNIDIVVKCLSSRERMQKTVNGEKTLITGLIADRSMIRRFVSWDGALLEKGKVYRIKGASAKTFRGEVEINLNAYTSIEEDTEGGLEDLDTSKLPRFGSLREVDLKDVRPGMGNIRIMGKVLYVEERTIETERGKKTIYDGMIADHTKRMRFTSWHDHGLDQDDVVEIRGAYVKDWRGIPQINFDERAEVEKHKGEDMDVMETPRLMAEDLADIGATDVKVGGTVIEVRDGSGLIFRCPECNRALIGGSCSLHGEQEGEPDLRTKIVVDDGTGALFAVLNTEITEGLLGLSVKECVKDYCDDEEILRDMLEKKLLGKDFCMRGNVIRDDFGPTVLPTKMEPEEIDSLERARELLKITEGI